MICVDTWLLYSGATASNQLQYHFYMDLAEELIDNSYGTIGGSARRHRDQAASPGGGTGGASTPRSGIQAHLTPTKKRQRPRGSAVLSRNSLQGKCRVCRRKTTHECSVCVDENSTESAWICHTKTRRTCFDTHLGDIHST
mmetsp:Transcript_35120/g.52203  ORF Transcript_35120/g.52203 Transcript_35120/m.52203 type:complete len:141 (+) Transcript_35120:1039-1461(+)